MKIFLYIVIFIFITPFYSQYAIKSIKYTNTPAGLNLILQGQAEIGLFQYDDIGHASYSNSANIIEIYPSFYQVGLPITPNPNRNFIISVGYRSDYYFNKDIASNTHNPITLNTNYLIECDNENPYKCSDKYERTILCVDGVRLMKYGVIHLSEKMFLYNGFMFEGGFMLYGANKLYLLISNHYDTNIDDFYSDFVTNNYSFSHIQNSILLIISSDSIEVSNIDSVGTINLIVRAECNTVNKDLKNTIKIDYSIASFEDCLGEGVVLGSANSDYFGFVFKLYINYKLILCTDIDLSSIDPLQQKKKSYLSLISYNFDNNKNGMVFISLSTQLYESQYEIKNNNNELYCNIDTTNTVDTLTISNLSKSKEEVLSILYMRNSLEIKSNNAFRFCKSNDHNYMVLPLSRNGNNKYYIKYHHYRLTSLSITNIHSLNFDINSIFPLTKSIKLYSPESLYEICVFSSYKLYHIGYCTCEVCKKSTALSLSYSTEKKEQCLNKYNSECNCYSSINPITFHEYKLCRHCNTNSDCAMNYKKATCEKETCICQNNENDLYYTATGQNIKINAYAEIESIAISQVLMSCIDCLDDVTKTETQCLTYCAAYQVTDFQIYTYPSLGSFCNLCIFSSEYAQLIKKEYPRKFYLIKKCILFKHETFENECIDTIINEGFVPTQFFIGLLSHFRVECPSRPFIDNGSVCAPWFGFNDLNMFTLVYRKTDTVKQWDTLYQCMNSNCEPSTKADCTLNGDTCVCYDTCPKGKGKFFGNEEIPCSGNGVCSVHSGCICDYGFVGENCATNCSEMDGGCCMDDSDCVYLNNPDYSKCIIRSNTNIGYCWH